MEYKCNDLTINPVIWTFCLLQENRCDKILYSWITKNDALTNS